MGTLSTGSWMVEFDDRLLAHLQIVIINKFRRGECFLISWLDALAIGDGRSSVWLTPDSPAYFKFSGSRTPSIDEDWLRRLSASASTSTGLVVVDEAGRPVRAGDEASLGSVPKSGLGRIPSP